VTYINPKLALYKSLILAQGGIISFWLGQISAEVKTGMVFMSSGDKEGARKN
jgi:hypothetical protein